MSYKVTFYCPDSHLVYNLHTLDDQGIGGGVTARIRIAHALSETGHSVTIYNNCPRKQVICGVQYVPFDQAKEIDTEVFIASTSGGNLDLALVNQIDPKAKLKLLMVHGIDPPKGVGLSGFNFIYSLSNFVSDRITNIWNVPGDRIFTSYRGVKEDYYQPIEISIKKKDRYGLVYISHPSKGLSAALDLLDLLRKKEPDLTLHVYGGYGLWGDDEKPIDNRSNVYYHGLIGQKELAQELENYSFAIFIQDREEPFGISLIESMKAGCIPFATNVGAFPEIIVDGYNGFLFDHKNTDSNINAASKIILDLIDNEEYSDFVRNNAISTPLSWKNIAFGWTGHWDYIFNRRLEDYVFPKTVNCPHCNDLLLPLADGNHCIGCGRYIKQITP